MANWISKLTWKKSFFLMPGVIALLLAGGSAASSSSLAAPQQAKPSNERIQQQTPSRVGEVEQQTTRMDYSRQADKGQTITYPGASFIKVHFLTLDLLPGDYVTVSAPSGAEKYTYPGSAFTSDGESGFWSMSITGDTALIQLHTQLTSGQLSEAAAAKSGFVIDKYGRGYPQEEIERSLPRSTCGANQRRDVACYQETHPTEFDQSDAVARALIYYSDGFYANCTAWRVGVGASMFTNQHCLDSQTMTAASEIWFNYQNQTCGGLDVNETTKAAGNKLLVSDLVLDFTLFTVSDPEAIANFGFLDIDARPPQVEEQIYIPQHASGSPKQFGIESDLDLGNVCRIDVAVMDGLDNGTDTGYFCDTAGGSSGAPVLASSSHEVIALHHFASPSPPTCTTPNQGVRMDLIWPRVERYLLQTSPFGSTSDSQPTYTWNEVSGATWYYLWVNGAGGNLVKQWYQASSVCNAGLCSATPDVILVGDGAYQWWIQTWGPDGYGPWSSGLSFSTPVIEVPPVPVLTSPSGSTSNYNPTYTWNEVLSEGTSPATWYYLWVNGPSGNVLKQWYQASTICSAGACSAIPDINLNAGDYTFWVQGWNNRGYGPWSSSLNFSVSSLDPTSLISPSGDIETNNPVYTWSEVTGASWYYLWVNGPSGNVIKTWYTAAQANCIDSTCSITADTALSAGAYTWWVRTWNHAGYGPWSPGMSFTIPP